MPSPLATGQAIEFAVWTELIQQSHGGLHVFLPLLDRGLDAVLHRLADGAYLPVQVKGRTELDADAVHLHIPVEELVDDRALIIGVLLTAAGLGPTVLVITEGDLRRVARREGDLYVAEFTMRPTARTRWRTYLVPRERLAAALLGEAVAPPPALLPAARGDSWLGFLGEAEVVRRLAESPRLDLFRPFPDLETVEVLVRDNLTGACAGLQVKTAAAAPGRRQLRVQVARHSFRPAPSTSVVALAWLPGTGRFHEECLVIPSEALAGLADVDGDYLSLAWHPGTPRQTRLDSYRTPLARLPEEITPRP